MSISLKSYAALLSSAAFVYSTLTLAQAPIVDASVESTPDSQTTTEPQVSAPADSSGQGELFYQLQLLQQEVMQLRGVVEEQAYLLKQVKEQNMERYIDLDRRLGEMATAPAVATAGTNTNVTTAPGANTAALTVVAAAGERDAYDAAYQLVTERRFDEALEAFKQFMVDFPQGKYTPNSYYWMGELYQVITPQDLEAARQSFTQLLDQYPSHVKVPDAMYKLGKVYFLKGDKNKARSLLEEVVSKYSKGTNSSAADKARQFINANY
ncbi:tol-pal system protein YbgF [Oceanicoccus sagamiensis]|uniref:Cell division coordinator CpoB n=1 Tax=Oceanicoccus sagamiensis TaxID=716816 RepID=A0A1X9NHU9_9GAMM|nr:tol-pal system protein YbgF [Oceanicoccus sagamiensis]ARN75089.1 tol-pal system protein YbgF [Oceanicoccus sagamiensis]